MGSSYYMVGLCWLHAGKKDRACEAFNKGSFYGDSFSRMQLSKICAIKGWQCNIIVVEK
jgi:hypothetical protein